MAETVVLYEYAVLRVVPRVEREEFLNVGVLLWCRSAEFLGARTGVDTARLLAVAPEADVHAVRRHVEALEGVCAGRDGAGPAGGEPPGQRFRWLTAPRSTLLQTSAVHCGLTRDPAGELSRLFALLVGERA